MKKQVVFVSVVATVLVVALAATAQQGGGMERFRQRREAQMKALDTLQQNAAQLKAAMEASSQRMRNRQSFQDMSEEERNKMREEFAARREEQRKLTGEMEQALLRLKGSTQLWAEYDESVAPLKELLASAQSEKATATAAKVEQLLAQHQKQFEDQLTALGYDPTQRPRMRGPQ